MIIKPEIVPFNEAFRNSFTYENFKEGNFYTKCVFENVEAEKKPVVLIFSNFKALMRSYNIKMQTYKGLIFTTKELEDIAEGDKYGDILKILKLELKLVTIEDEEMWRRAKIYAGIIEAYHPEWDIETMKKVVADQFKKRKKKNDSNQNSKT